MPFQTGNTLKGWGVIRRAPWHFAGLYETKEAAQARAEELGPDYEVHAGENK